MSDVVFDTVGMAVRWKGLTLGTSPTSSGGHSPGRHTAAASCRETAGSATPETAAAATATTTGRCYRSTPGCSTTGTTNSHVCSGVMAAVIRALRRLLNNDDLLGFRTTVVVAFVHLLHDDWMGLACGTLLFTPTDRATVVTFVS